MILLLLLRKPVATTICAYVATFPFGCCSITSFLFKTYKYKNISRGMQPIQPIHKNDNPQEKSNYSPFHFCLFTANCSRNCVRASLFPWAYGVVVSMIDFHHSDRGSNPGRGGKIS